MRTNVGGSIRLELTEDSVTAVLRGVLALQAAALMAQAGIAGAALSGGGGLALQLHMALGSASLLLAVVQVGLALLLWRRRPGAGWLAGASFLFLAAEAVQLVAGRAQVFALHLPLGVALFAAAVGLAIWRMPANASARTDKGP